MSFRTSPLYSLVEDIRASGFASGNWRWNFEFQILEGAPVWPTRDNGAVTPREEEGYFSILDIQNIDINRDYCSGRKYEHMNAILAVAAGVWIKFLLPNREFLRLHATRVALERRGGDYDVETPADTLVLKPLFRINKDNNSQHSAARLMTRQELDIKGVIELDIDLLDPVIEQFKKLLVGGEVWRDAKASDVLRAYYTKHSQEVLIDGEPVMRGMSMTAKTQDNKRKHISIRQATPFLQLPELLQDDAGGIWSSGLSAFLQDRRWWIWPSYDTASREDQDFGATIAIVPPMDYQSVERTFKLDGDQLLILAGATISANDLQQVRFLNEGDGVRFTSAASMVGKWGDTLDNKLGLYRGPHNTEVQLEDPNNQSHYAPASPEWITDNNLAQLSRIAARRGFIINCMWENADHNLIMPGMFFTILTLLDDEIVQFYARATQMHVSYQKISVGMQERDMTSTVALTLFCNPAV